MSRPLAVIGPTGTGKSDLALELAERIGGEIVNADAMQQYRGMDIGTAKLPPQQRRGIPHHQLDCLDIIDTASVARYQGAAVADVEAIAARGAVPVIVGGITSDRLYPLRLQEELAELLPGCAQLKVVDSIYGHDGFLVETEAVGELIRETLELATR